MIPGQVVPLPHIVFVIACMKAKQSKTTHKKQAHLAQHTFQRHTCASYRIDSGCARRRVWRTSQMERCAVCSLGLTVSFSHITTYPPLPHSQNVYQHVERTSLFFPVSVNDLKKNVYEKTWRRKPVFLRSDRNPACLNVSGLHQNLAKFSVHSSAYQESQPKGWKNFGWSFLDS